MSTKAFEALHHSIVSGEVSRTGKLPDIYLEEERIVDPESPDGQAFQAEMERILKNIRPGYFDKDGKLLRQVKFVLSDSEDENAYIVGIAQSPAVVCFKKGILKICENEDQIAHILGHEMQHDAFAIEKGNGPNSLPEELGCNILPLNWMLEKRGDTYAYNIEAASRFADRHAARVGSHPMNFLAALDVHGLPSMEAAAISGAVAALEVQHRNLPEPTPVSNETTRLLKEAAHLSVFQKVKRDHPDFDQLPISQRLEIIYPAVAGLRSGMITRATDFRAMLSAIFKDPARNEADVNAAAIKFLDVCLEHPDVYNAAHVPLCRVFSLPENNFGKQKEVHDSVSSFIGAGSNEEAERHAKTIAAAFDIYSKIPAFNAMQWPKFEIPGEHVVRVSTEGDACITPSWSKHVLWAKQAISEGNWDIAKALWAMGVAPKALFDLAPDGMIEAYQHGGKFAENGNMQRLQLDENGNIIGLQPKGGSLKKDTKAYLDHRQGKTPAPEERTQKNPTKVATPEDSVPIRSDLPPIERATPEQFYEHFRSYIAIYRQQLTPPEEWWGDFKDGKMQSSHEKKWMVHYQCCQAVVEKMQALLDQDAKKFGPFVRSFMLDQYQGVRASDLMDEGRHGVPAQHAGQIESLQVNPFVGFMLSESHEIFSLEERMKFLEPAAAHIPLRFFEKRFGVPLTQPLGQAELEHTLDTYKNAGEKIYPIQVMAGQLICKHLADGTREPGKKADIARLLIRYPHFFDFVASNNVELSRAIQQGSIALAKKGFQVFEENTHTLRDELGISEELEISNRSASKTEYGKALDRIKYSGAMPESLATNRAIIFEALENQTHWPEDAPSLLSVYRTLDRCVLFPSNAWRKNFVEKILMAIKQIPTAQERLSTLSDFLSGSEIKDVYLKSQVIEMWSDAILSVAGGVDPGYSKEQADSYAAAGESKKDETRTPYHKKIRELITPVRERATLHTKFQALSKLADVIEAQHEVAMDLGNLLNFSREDMVGSSHKFSQYQILASVLGKNSSKELRGATLNFLSGDLNEDALKAYAAKLDETIESDTRDRADEMVFNVSTIREMAIASAGIATDPENQGTYDTIADENQSKFDALEDEARNFIEEEIELLKFSTNPAKLVELAQLYENFWTAPLAVRAVIMKELLISPNERLQGVREEGAPNAAAANAFQESMRYVLDKVAPKPPRTADKETKYANRVLRTMIQAYALSISEVQAPYFLAALLSASKRTRDSGEVPSASEMAANILISLGPAERKICQAISNSSEFTPEVTRPFAKAKGEGLVLPRWEDLRRMKEVAAADFFEKEGIVRVGSRLGGASIYTFYDTEEQSGKRGAFGIREANAIGNAKAGFDIAERFVENIKKIDPKLAEKIPVTLSDIIDIAKKDTAAELDTQTGLEQHRLLHKLYDGITVKVDGVDYHYSAAELKAYGDEFRYQEQIPGQHFKDLPITTPEQQADKKRRAIAHITVGLYRWLGGDPKVRGYFDSDDHDAQGRAYQSKDGSNCYGRFDPGGINIVPRTEAESKQLGRSLVHILLAHAAGQSLDTAIYQEIQDVRNADPEHKTPHYLISSQRALLALNPFRVEAGNDSVIKVIASLLQAEQIDPAIKEGVMEEGVAVTDQILKLQSQGKFDTPMMKSLMDTVGELNKEKPPFVVISQNKQRTHPEPRFYDAGAVALGGEKTLEKLDAATGEGSTKGKRATGSGHPAEFAARLGTRNKGGSQETTGVSALAP